VTDWLIDEICLFFSRHVPNLEFETNAKILRKRVILHPLSFVLFFRRWRISAVERENIFSSILTFPKNKNKIDRELFFYTTKTHAKQKN
jgi:hypothetical protein